MAVVGAGIILMYIGLAIIGFIIFIIVLRWALGINKIVDLLTDISNSLRLRKVASAPTTNALPGQTTSTGQPANVQSGHFGISASDLSAGDWIVDREGQRYQVADFKGKDLILKQEGRVPIRVSPPFNYRKE